MARNLINRSSWNRLLVQGDTLERFIGKVRSSLLAVRDTELHFRGLYECVTSSVASGTRTSFVGVDSGFRKSRRLFLIRRCTTYFRFLMDLPQKLHHRPIWQDIPNLTVTFHMNASIQANGWRWFEEVRIPEPLDTSGDVGSG